MHLQRLLALELCLQGITSKPVQKLRSFESSKCSDRFSSVHVKSVIYVLAQSLGYVIKYYRTNYNIVLNINWFPKQAGCSASPRSKKVPLWRAEAARGSVSSVWRPLRDERHEESYDERPRGGQEARVGGAVRILRSFLPTFPIVVRAVVHHSFLQGKKTTYEQSIRRAAAGLTLTYAALF